MNPRKLLVGFYGGGLPFHGDTLKEASLGGSETAMLCMARELAALGHDVKVFNNCPKSGRYDGVDYYNYQEMWREISPLLEWDVFIIARDYTFLAQKLHARLVGLWNHDIATDSRSIMTNIWGADFAWCLSDFHLEQFLSVAPKIKPICYTTRNGVDLALIDAARARATKRLPNVFVYGARPERGLDILLQRTWPRVVKEVDPTAVLMIAGYSHEGLKLPDHIVEYYRFLEDVIKETPNVERVGNLTKAAWYDLLCGAGQMLYPTSFPEISCINALEAQACGLPMVTTANFALVETVGDRQNLIPGNPKTDEYQNAFIARVKRLKNNEFEYKLSQKKGRQHIENTYEWKTIAEEWQDFFWAQFEARSQLNGGRNVLKNMVYHSDLLAARWALEHPTDSGVVTAQCQTVASEVNYYLGSHHEDPEDYHAEQNPVDRDDVWDHIPRFTIATQHMRTHFEARPFTALDVGCGAGGFLAKLLKEFPDQVSVMGIDFSQQLVDRAAKLIETRFQLKGEFVVCGDFMTLPIDEPADCAFAGEWLEHQQDVYGALERLEQWVKPGGLAVITIPNGPWEAMSYQRQEGKRFHVSHFEFRDIEELFGRKKFNMEFTAVGISPIDGALLGNWIISWEVDHEPFGAIDYRRKFLTMRPYQSVSACMIVKDEEDNLSRCLKSIQTQMDEIVVVDTGSTDETVRIAKKFTDKVIEMAWPDDFGEARNASIAHANPEADWIYWMDADEVLLNPEKLRKYLRNRLFNGYVITQNHLVLDMPNVKPDVPVRIYRNHMGIKFYGAIHEHCEMALDTPIDPVLILPEVKIAHYGYITEGVRRHKCKDRNLALLKKDREKYPERMLGIVLMMRDYLNVSQWELESSRGQYTPQILKMLQEVVRLHRQYFADDANMYHELSHSLYQRALSALGRQALAGVEGTELIPFEVLFGMGGSVGGMTDPGQVRTNSFWFLDREELLSFVQTRAQLLAETLKLPETKKRKA